jgi:hypothetical protein
MQITQFGMFTWLWLMPFITYKTFILKIFGIPSAFKISSQSRFVIRGLKSHVQVMIISSEQPIQIKVVCCSEHLFDWLL